MKPKGNKNKLSQYIQKGFTGVTLALLFVGSIYALRQTKDINYYENRAANTFKKLTFKNFNNGNFQNSIDGTLADQLPLSLTLKKIYNFGNSLLTKYITKLFIGKYCENNYINYNGISTFGCDDVLVYSKMMYNDNYSGFENRIFNINNTIKKSLAPIYVYYIERDSDIDFSNNEKSDRASVLKNKINTDNIHIYEVKNFEDYTEKFYKTDHHWNHKGSYQGYIELHEFLGLNDKILVPLAESCHHSKWEGSKVRETGSQSLYNDKLCAYSFDIPEHKTIMNSAQKLGANNVYDVTNVSYGGLYGWDYGEIILDFNQPKKENILLIGESYDNAIIKLIGSHYNKTYSVDLRHYTNETGKLFKLNEYIKNNDIDKVVLIGNYGFFVDSTFNIEV